MIGGYSGVVVVLETMVVVVIGGVDVMVTAGAEAVVVAQPHLKKQHKIK